MNRTLQESAAAIAAIVWSEPVPARALEAKVPALGASRGPVMVSPVTDPVEASPDSDSMVSVSDGEPEGSGTWTDETAEAEFLAGARDRGEVVKPSVAEIQATDEREAQPLPTIEELVERIPAGVRDTLEDLFRAKFVKVQRVPKRAFKSAT